MGHRHGVRTFRTIAMGVLLLAYAATGVYAGGGSEQQAASADYRDYLNLGSTKPVFQDGADESIVLTAAIAQPSNGGDWQDLWIGKYYEEYLNMNLDVEQIPVSALNERKNLMFAADAVPDMLLHLRLTPAEIARYGQLEGQLLQMDRYLDEELTPNVNAWFEERPEALALSTTPDGHIYSLPRITDRNAEGGVPRLFVNTRWLETVGMEMPRTLDEFAEMARAFKEADPDNVGQENVIPIGGGFEAYDLSYFILNAMGYVGGPDPLSSGFIRDGAVDIPAGNRTLFREFLSLMNTFYEEGLIARNYFTTDTTEVNAQLIAGRVGVYGQPVYVSGIETWSEWTAPEPLTSEWNDEPVWKAPNSVGVGGFAVSSNTAYPHAALRFADVYFGDDSRILWIGPIDGSEEAMGYLGMTPGVEGTVFDESRFPAGINNLWDYLMGHIGPQPLFGTVDIRRHVVQYERERKGYPAEMERVYDLNNPDQHYRASVRSNLVPYIATGFPTVYYLDEETTIRLADLKAVIEPFVEEQVALFVTGARPISEFDAYLSELDSIGFQEYLSIHQLIWDNYLAALSQ